MATSSRRPLARADELVIEELGDELLVYDLKIDRAHSLSEDAARVWQRCDGKVEVESLPGELRMDPDTVTRALDELEACALLDAGVADNNGVTRRELSVRAAKIGAAATAAPLIWSIASPTPAAAFTPTIEFCLEGQTTHGCGVECHTGKCGCCCCQRIPDNLKPFACRADDKCCLPPTQCGTMFQGHCSAGPFGPPKCQFPT